MEAVTFHESDDRLERYVMRRLSGSEIEEVEEHLLLCESCRERLDEFEKFLTDIRNAGRGQPVTETSSGWFPWLRPRFAVAGAFASVVLAIGIYWVGGRARLAPVAFLQLTTAVRGNDVQTVARARELDLSFVDAPPSSRLDVVDSNGATVWTGTLAPRGGRSEAIILRALSPGEYYARAYAPSGQMLQEYEFRVIEQSTSPGRK